MSLRCANGPTAPAPASGSPLEPAGAGAALAAPTMLRPRSPRVPRVPPGRESAGEVRREARGAWRGVAISPTSACSGKVPRRFRDGSETVPRRFREGPRLASRLASRLPLGCLGRHLGSLGEISAASRRDLGCISSAITEVCHTATPTPYKRKMPTHAPPPGEVHESGSADGASGGAAASGNGGEGGRPRSPPSLAAGGGVGGSGGGGSAAQAEPACGIRKQT